MESKLEHEMWKFSQNWWKRKHILSLKHTPEESSKELKKNVLTAPVTSLPYSIHPLITCVMSAVSLGLEDFWGWMIELFCSVRTNLTPPQAGTDNGVLSNWMAEWWTQLILWEYPRCRTLTILKSIKRWLSFILFSSASLWPFLGNNLCLLV